MKAIVAFKCLVRNTQGGTLEIDKIDVAGGVGSPRHYGGVSKEQPLLSPSHSHSACPATPTHNQHNATNTQHFSNQQHTSMLYHNNANTINTADMQNSQYCYDRTSVPLYSSGEAQDARSLPPSNPVNHQMGGKSCDLLMSCDHHTSSSSPWFLFILKKKKSISQLSLSLPPLPSLSLLPPPPSPPPPLPLPSLFRGARHKFGTYMEAHYISLFHNIHWNTYTVNIRWLFIVSSRIISWICFIPTHKSINSLPLYTSFILNCDRINRFDWKYSMYYILLI